MTQFERVDPHHQKISVTVFITRKTRQDRTDHRNAIYDTNIVSSFFLFMIRVIGLLWNKLGTMSLLTETIFIAAPIKSTDAEVIHLLLPEVGLCPPGI
jgi:hypothetical protein